LVTERPAREQEIAEKPGGGTDQGTTAVVSI